MGIWKTLKVNPSPRYHPPQTLNLPLLNSCVAHVVCHEAGVEVGLSQGVVSTVVVFAFGVFCGM